MFEFDTKELYNRIKDIINEKCCRKKGKRLEEEVWDSREVPFLGDRLQIDEDNRQESTGLFDSIGRHEQENVRPFKKLKVQRLAFDVLRSSVREESASEQNILLKNLNSGNESEERMNNQVVESLSLDETLKEHFDQKLIKNVQKIKQFLSGENLSSEINSSEKRVSRRTLEELIHKLNTQPFSKTTIISFKPRFMPKKVLLRQELLNEVIGLNNILGYDHYTTHYSLFVCDKVIGFAEKINSVVIPLIPLFCVYFASKFCQPKIYNINQIIKLLGMPNPGIRKALILDLEILFLKKVNFNINPVLGCLFADCFSLYFKLETLEFICLQFFLEVSLQCFGVVKQFKSGFLSSCCLLLVLRGDYLIEVKAKKKSVIGSVRSSTVVSNEPSHQQRRYQRILSELSNLFEKDRTFFIESMYLIEAEISTFVQLAHPPETIIKFRRYLDLIFKSWVYDHPILRLMRNEEPPTHPESES